MGDSTVQFMCVGSAFALTLYKQSKIRFYPPNPESNPAMTCQSKVHLLLTNNEKLNIFLDMNYSLYIVFKLRFLEVVQSAKDKPFSIHEEHNFIHKT